MFSSKDVAKSGYLVVFVFRLPKWSFLYLHMPILAYVFWRLHIILDMADGAPARATGNFSPLATGFDRCNHIVVNTTVISAVAFQYGSVVSANARSCLSISIISFSETFTEKGPQRW